MDKIIVKGARENNLKNVDIEIPKNKLTVMTGVSGSGKSSLAFDTIYAEGQRRYVESLSAYARQFLGGTKKPDVDSIEGLSPSISIDQKTTNNNPRSTVGTVTEIYDYFRLLFARIGVPYCPNHNIPITSQSIEEMTTQIMNEEDKTKLIIMSPVIYGQKGTFKDLLDSLRKDGYVRVKIDDEVKDLSEEINLDKNKKHNILVVIDRVIKKEEARSRIYVTTDKERGALKTLADNEGYEKFVVPDNVGGRYSVLTAVGLLPIAVAGIDIDKIMEGARTAQEKYEDSNLKYNACYQYAVVRNILYKLYKNTEILVNYEPKMHYFTEWWKQLYGESEGKDQLGIFPAGVDFTTDLHSMGQYIQEGRRNLFETVIRIEKSESDIDLKEEEDNLDGLNYLAGKTLDYVNKKAMEGTVKAHVSGDVPNIMIDIENLDEENIGELIYFFEKACAMSGMILGVNPFNQPGVEEYKKNMFKLLKKPGY